ncbi:hypothetical protein THAOC_19492, partial [Thalassiosira oceanica]
GIEASPPTSSTGGGPSIVDFRVLPGPPGCPCSCLVLLGAALQPGLIVHRSSGSNSLTKGSNVANLGKRNVEAPGKSLSDRTEAVGDNWALAPAPNIRGTKSRRANEAEATLVRSPLDTARGSVDSTEARLPSTFAASVVS